MTKTSAIGLLFAGLLSAGPLLADGGAAISLVEPDGPQSLGPLVGGSADHIKFEILQQAFADGPAVTEACLSCHTESGRHFMNKGGRHR